MVLCRPCGQGDMASRQEMDEHSEKRTAMPHTPEPSTLWAGRRFPLIDPYIHDRYDLAPCYRVGAV